MNSPKTYVTLLLALTTLGGAFVAWRQYGELVELRAAAMNRNERADLQKRVWDLEKLNRELRDRADPGGPANLLAEGAAGNGPGRGRMNLGDRGSDSRPRGISLERQAVALRDLMSKPEVQAMLSLQQQLGIEARYSALFKNLNLAPEQIDKLKSLLAERSTTLQDVVSAARDQGINPRENPDAYRKLASDAQNEINNGIKGVIGEEGFAQLTTYEQTLPQRNVVNELQQRLSYSSTPLTATQAEQMVQILAANAPVRSNASGNPGGAGPASGAPPFGAGLGTPGGELGGVIGALGGGPSLGMLLGGMEAGTRATSGAPVTTAAVDLAQGILAPPQIVALQQIQQQQQAQQQLRQMVTDTLTAPAPNPPTAAGNAPGGTSPPANTGTGSSGRKRGGG